VEGGAPAGLVCAAARQPPAKTNIPVIKAAPVQKIADVTNLALVCIAHSESLHRSAIFRDDG
jgi:hypothetical protein